MPRKPRAIVGTFPDHLIPAGSVTNAMLAGSIAASKLVGTDIATVGTVTAGTWNSAITMPSALAGTPVAGAIEWDGFVFYASNAASKRAVIEATYFISLLNTYTLSNVNTQQALYGSSNNTFTLATGLYEFEALVSVSSMSATSGNAKIDWLGAGTATITSWQWAYTGVDNATAQVGAWQSSMQVTNVTGASMVTATINTGLQFWAKGTFRVTVAGTVIPSITLVTAAAAVVGVGSFIKIKPLGSATAVAGGPVS